MDGEKKNIVYVVIALIIIALLGWWLLSSKGSGTGSDSTATEKAPPGPQLAPALQLTAKEKAGNVGDKKAQIVARVKSSTPLTPEEKAEIGGIMLTKANIYNFSEEERVAIFEALSK